jgi:hypothetical protein
MKENMQSYTALELLQMGLNCVHESAHSVYLKHVYNGTVAETFLGDNLFGTDRTIPIEDRVDNAVKRVHKLSAAAKAAVGKTGRGGSSTVKRGGAGGRGGSSNYKGAGRGTTTAISGSVIFHTADPTMELLAAMEEAKMAKTVFIEHVLYVDPLGIRPSSVLRETSLKLCASFPNGKMRFKPVGCVSWSSPSEVA